MEENNTARSFKDKWENNRGLVFADTLREDSTVGRWILSRNGWNNHAGLKAALKDKKRILDGGCGNGRVTALLSEHCEPGAEVVGVDLVSSPVAQENLKNMPNVSFFEASLVGDLSRIGTFDFIYCQEVLHHTGDAKKGFGNLCSVLEVGGEIAIYVYKLKAPVREYVDDYIRGKIKGLSYQEAMTACEEITSLGKVLHDSGVKLSLPEVSLLGISSGEYDLQRFIYHFFAKCFWNDEMSFDDNVAINYDWYHPQDCTRHTLEEVRAWFIENGLNVVHEFVDHYGITMRGVKPL